MTQPVVDQSSLRPAVLRETPVALVNEYAERAVIAATLLSPEAALLATSLVTPAEFASPRHRVLFAAVTRVQASGRRVDPLTLTAELESAGDLKSGAHEYIGGLLDEIPTTAGLEHWADLVRKAASRRQLLALGRKLTAAAEDPTLGLDEVRDLASRELLAAVQGEQASGFQPIAVGVEEMLQRLQALDAGTIEPGLLTGFPELDDKLDGGFQPGDFVLVVGVPSSGKTSLMVNVLHEIAETGGGATALVSAEVKRSSVSRNLVSNRSNVPVAHIRKGTMTTDERRRVARAAVELAAIPFEVDDTDTPTIEDVVVRATLLKAKRPNLQAIGVDFLQMVQRRERERGESEELALERTSYDLKGLAKRLGIVVFAAVQPNDKQVEDREDKRPTLRDIARSSGPRRAADIVLLLYRPGQYSPSAPPVMEVNIGKFREGALDFVILDWEGSFVRVNSPRRKKWLAEEAAARNRQFEITDNTEATDAHG